MIYLNETIVGFTRSQWTIALADHLGVTADRGEYEFKEGATVGSFRLYSGKTQTASGDLTIFERDGKAVWGKE